MSHYVLDRTCHPYIFYKTGFPLKGTIFSIYHSLLETDIDVLMEENFNDKPSFKEMLKVDNKDLKLVSKMMKALADYLNKDRIDEKSYYHSVKTMLTVNRCINSKIFGFRKFIFSHLMKNSVINSMSHPKLKNLDKNIDYLNLNENHPELHSEINKIQPSNQKDFDYEQIAEFMNLHNGKYINLWKGYSKTDDVANINKLALFVRSISRINKLNFYTNLPEHDWEICMDGIINRPKEVIRPLMKYKFDSSKINNGISKGTLSKTIKERIERIENFLDSQKIKYDVKAYRGEGHFGILSVVKLDKDKTLQNAIEEFTQGIESGKYSVQQIDEFVKKYLFDVKIQQSRFLSTAIEKEAGDRYAKKILWYLDIPKGTKGSMIECYNVERASEAELLLQKGSEMFIKNARYNKDKHIWELWAAVLQ